MGLDSPNQIEIATTNSLSASGELALCPLYLRERMRKAQVPKERARHALDREINKANALLIQKGDGIFRWRERSDQMDRAFVVFRQALCERE